MKPLIFSVVIVVGCFSRPVRRACMGSWAELTRREKWQCLVG
jgi:hypothetical protein